MEALLQLGRKFMNLKRDQIMFKTMQDNPKLKALVIELNQQNQLQHGINGKGEMLPDYSETSVNVFGKRPGPFTLEDTGEFYKSFEVELFEGGFEIEADGIKLGTFPGSHGDRFEFETDLVELYDPLGLIDDSISKFNEVLLPLIQRTILNAIQK